jgi:hypothetical protein
MIKNNLSVSTTLSGRRVEARLLLKVKETCDALGGIHPRTLARMEKGGLIRSVKLIRHKLYAAKDVEDLVENLRNWNKEATK